MERIITKSFARLMGRGTHRGFITYEELSKSLGKRNLSEENLSQALIHILEACVVLVEKKSDYKVLRKKESSSKEEGKSIEKSDQIYSSIASFETLNSFSQAGIIKTIFFRKRIGKKYNGNYKYVSLSKFIN